MRTDQFGNPIKAPESVFTNKEHAQRYCAAFGAHCAALLATDPDTIDLVVWVKIWADFNEASMIIDHWREAIDNPDEGLSYIEGFKEVCEAAIVEGWQVYQGTDVLKDALSINPYPAAVQQLINRRHQELN